MGSWYRFTFFSLISFVNLSVGAFSNNVTVKGEVLTIDKSNSTVEIRNPGGAVLSIPLEAFDAPINEIKRGCSVTAHFQFSPKPTGRKNRSSENVEPGFRSDRLSMRSLLKPKKGQVEQETE
jgi:hypothetical protein